MRQLLLLVPTFIAGLVLGAWALSRGDTPEMAVNAAVNYEREGEYQRLEDMIDSLTEIVNFEVSERSRLEGEIARLTQRLDALAAADTNQADSASLPAVAVGTPASVRARASNQVTEERLVEAGFAADVAVRLKRQLDEVALERLYLRDQAMREGWLGSTRYREELRALNARQNQVRNDLSPEEYDRYLWAMGRPNRVTVNSVLSGSPAEQAGLQPGDQILSYGGQRIFGAGEIRRESGRGIAGESIAVEILRNGQPQLVYVPRGPLGVQMGSAVVKP